MPRDQHGIGAVGPQRSTLKQIALAAGVSRSTVSLVLRDSPLVAEATRARVRQAMTASGYLYDRGAARLRTGVSRTVGLIVTDITNPFYAELTAGMDAALDRADWLAFLATSGDLPERQGRLIRRMREQGADGIVLGPAEGTPCELLDELSRCRFPCVQILRHVAEGAFDYVGPDYTLGMTLAVEHLIGLGHRRLGYLRSPRRTSATRERLAAYEATLARHGLTPGPVATCEHSRAHAAGIVAAMMRDAGRPTALVCHNDVMALGALAGLSRSGLAPGRDVAVIGFDDIAEAATSIPPLSTVATRPGEVGGGAAELLLRRIADPGGPPERIVLPPRLIVRAT